MDGEFGVPGILQVSHRALSTPSISISVLTSSDGLPATSDDGRGRSSGEQNLGADRGRVMHRLGGRIIDRGTADPSRPLFSCHQAPDEDEDAFDPGDLHEASRPAKMVCSRR